MPGTSNESKLRAYRSQCFWPRGIGLSAPARCFTNCTTCAVKQVSKQSRLSGLLCSLRRWLAIRRWPKWQARHAAPSPAIATATATASCPALRALTLRPPFTSLLLCHTCCCCVVPCPPPRRRRALVRLERGCWGSGTCACSLHIFPETGAKPCPCAAARAARQHNPDVNARVPKDASCLAD
jgi:hypothetical protein